MNITDERLKARTLRAISLQEQGCFILDHRQELPLPAVDLHYSRSYDEQGRPYDYETAWGKFSYDDETRSVLVMRQGAPPEELLPQPRLSLANATLHTGFASIHNNGSSFDLDFQTRDQLDYSALRLLNKTLLTEGIPVVVWKLDQEEENPVPIIRIANDSAMLFASSAIWDSDEQQLVAAQVVTTSQELLKAIKATLANNSSKSYLTVKTPEDSAYLKGARKGYVSVSSSLVQANAEGTVTALLHPLCGDPQTNTAGHFYLVAASDEPVSTLLAERLDLAIPWPIRSEWADYLLEAGKQAGLVQILSVSGDDFTAGLRIARNESLWQGIISEGLKTGRILIDP